MNDYISREAVLSKCTDIWDNADETTQTGVDTINTIDKITDFIESLPAADVQPVRRGKWIPKYDDNHGFHYICSNCDIISGTKLKFCFDCGADMRGEGNG